MTSANNSPKPAPPRLAFLGAPPVFSQPVPRFRPHLGNRALIHEHLNQVLDRNAPGPDVMVSDFEVRIADAVGAKHCVAASNAGAALEMALRGLDLGGEVILPAFMAPSMPHALCRQGITPVFCDIDARTRTLDPERAASLITPRTTGIVAAHLWGQPCAVETLQALARSRGLRLLFDARHAFGCSHKGRPIGGFGDAEVFQFDAPGVLYAFDGAAITTNDAGLARRLRILQNLGFDESGASVCLGLDGRMGEAAAAMGLACLERIHDAIEINRRIQARYDLQLTDVPGIVLLAADTMDQRNYQHVVVDVDHATAGISRDALLEVLRAENVLASRDYYPGGHRIEPYRIPNSEAWLRLPVTEQLADRVLSLPTGAGITDGVIDQICHCIRLAVAHAGPIMARMRPPARQH